ncbi:hypothetical protein FRC18_000979 [Serendipita sp. 400]|nr:hypothetical protein FRC18_000979 [Serendipita sp. 400]
MERSHFTVEPTNDALREDRLHDGDFTQEVTTGLRKSPIRRDIGNLYKPIKRCFYSLDQKQGEELVKNRGRSHQRAQSATERMMNCKTNRVVSLTYGAGFTSPETKRHGRFLNPGNAESIHLVRSVPSLLSSSGLSDSVQQSRLLVESRFKSQQYEATPDTKEGLTKALRAPASVYSTPHLIRPISAMLSKSAEMLGESFRIPYQKQKSPRLPGPISRNNSHENTLSFPKNATSGVFSPKSRSWAKILGGSVFSNSSRSISSSPEKTSSEEFDHQRSLLFSPRRKRNRSKETHGFEMEPVPPLLVPEATTKAEVNSISHPNPQGVANFEYTLSIQQCARVGLSMFTMQVFLFYSCPPSYMVELGGNGMLAVYAVLVIATGLLPWIMFGGDALPDVKAKSLLPKRSKQYITKLILCA